MNKHWCKGLENLDGQCTENTTNLVMFSTCAPKPWQTLEFLEIPCTETSQKTLNFFGNLSLCMKTPQFLQRFCVRAENSALTNAQLKNSQRKWNPFLRFSMPTPKSEKLCFFLVLGQWGLFCGPPPFCAPRAQISPSLVFFCEFLL